jgi:hypothetical protein
MVAECIGREQVYNKAIRVAKVPYRIPISSLILNLPTYSFDHPPKMSLNCQHDMISFISNKIKTIKATSDSSSF